MSGTKEGAKKATATNKRKYGADFYAKIGAKGGKLSNTGGFAYMKEHDPERLIYISKTSGGGRKRMRHPNNEDMGLPRNASPSEKNWLKKPHLK